MMFDRWFKPSRSKKTDPALPAASAGDAGHGSSPDDARAPVSANAPENKSEASVNDIDDVAPMPEAFSRYLLRQPVLDADHRLIGFDFGFRHQESPEISESARRLSDETLISTLVQLNIRSLAGRHLCFVGINPSTLEGAWLDMLPTDHVVLAIDAAHIADEAVAGVAEQCRARIEQGFLIALDNLPEADAEEELVGLAAYLRFDLYRHNAMDLNRFAIVLRGNANLRLVARQVNGEDDYQAARNMGFDAFQGYYFTRLNPSLPQRVDNDRMRVMELLNMTAGHAEFPVLEKAIKHDVLLSYKLLVYINSPLNGLSGKIESIAQALMFLGYEPLYRWLSLLLFADGETDPRDHALLQNALVRARLTETLGKNYLTPKDADSLFIVGIFSLLDVLLNMPLTQAIEHLNLPEPVTRALLRQHGPYAPFLRLAVAFENGDPQQVSELAETLGLNAQQVNQMHIEAINWALMLDA